MLDPLLLKIISVGFALLFVLSATHKFANKLQFRAVLTDYQILPQGAVAITARCIPVIELLLGCGWMLSVIVPGHFVFVPLVSAMLLTSYTLAIGINLMRGRRYIDCGGGFSSATGRNSNSNDNQHLSRGLLVRNGLLIFAAMLASLAPATRDIGFVDYLSLVAATIALILNYGSYNQLLVNNSAIGAWRNNLGDKTDG
jgi:hypothetical protein